MKAITTFLLRTYKINISTVEEIGAINPENQPAIVNFMAFVLHLRTTNHLYGFDLLITRELVPSFNVETVSQSSSKLVLPFAL